jgi:eukaryotic-like serine/threonine-protein kinase
VRENSHPDMWGAGWGVARVVAGRYLLRAAVGAGGMGVVWRADDLRLNREVALKRLRLPPGLTSDEAAWERQRVFREGRIAARLQHPNAVAVFDVTSDDAGEPMLVLEYLPSRSLAAVLDDHATLPPGRVARIGAAVASALAAAHAAGVVHRDVKPGNILLVLDGDAKITDFGLSHVAGDAATDGLVAGTPAFLAPESARGEPPSPESDVFSLGATLYAALEGDPPFGRVDDPMAQLELVADGQAPPPRRAGALTRVLTDMLRDDPAARPTMSQVADVLADLSGDDDTQPVPTTHDDPVMARLAADSRGDLTRPVPVVNDDMPHFAADVTRPVPVVHDDLATSQLPGDVTQPVPTPHETTHVDLEPVRTPPRTPPRVRQARRRTRVVLGLVAAALLVVLAVTLLSDSGDDGASRRADAPLSATQPPGSPATTTAPVVPSVAIAPPAEPPAPPAALPADPAQLRRVVTDYYTLLPADTNGAWALLGPAMQALDRDQYDRFWSAVKDLRIRPPRIEGTAVVVDVEYVQNGRGRVRETRRHEILVQGGTALINSDQVVAAER